MPQFLVTRWKGYTTESDTWEPEDNLVDSAEEILNEYKAKQFHVGPTRQTQHVRVAEPDDDPDWKVGDRYLWPDDWPMQAEVDEDEMSDDDEDKPRKPSPNSQW